MKKITLWVIPAFLNLSPTIAADASPTKEGEASTLTHTQNLSEDDHISELGIIQQDPFFDRDDVKKGIERIYENGSDIIVKFAGHDLKTYEKQIRRTRATFSHIGWNHDDTNHYSREKVLVKIQYEGKKGTQEFQAEYLRDLKFDYKKVSEFCVHTLPSGETVINNMELPFNVAFKVYQETVYEGSYDHARYAEQKHICTEKSNALHQAIVQVIHNDKVIDESDLFNLPLITPIEVVKKEIVTGKELEEIDGTVIYHLLLNQEITTKTSHECVTELPVPNFAGKGIFGVLLADSPNSKKLHFHKEYALSDITTHIHKIPLEQDQKKVLYKTQKRGTAIFVRDLKDGQDTCHGKLDPFYVKS